MSSHKIDPSTGMPALPDGWRWKIQNLPEWRDAIEVLLQQRRFGICLTRERNAASPTPASIIRAADRGLDLHQGKPPWLTSVEKKCLGTYGPKRLEDR